MYLTKIILSLIMNMALKEILHVDLNVIFKICLFKIYFLPIKSNIYKVYSLYCMLFLN